MNKQVGWAAHLGRLGLVTAALVLTGTTAVYAAPSDRDDQRDQRRDQRDDRGDRRDAPRDWDARRDRGARWSSPPAVQSREQHRYTSEYRYDQRDDRGDRRDTPRDWDARRDRGARWSPPAAVQSREQHRYTPEYRYREQDRYRPAYRPPLFLYHGRPYLAPRDRVRWYRDIVIVRPYGHWYPGYGLFFYDDDAYKWLAFTAITLGILDFLNEQQQREHEAAQIAATTAPIGERIIWKEGNASGYVVATREGTSVSGRYCREFQHQVTIGGRNEQAYGTACRNPDGSWEVVSDSGY